MPNGKKVRLTAAQLNASRNPETIKSAFLSGKKLQGNPFSKKSTPEETVQFNNWNRAYLSFERTQKSRGISPGGPKMKMNFSENFSQKRKNFSNNIKR